MNLDTFFHTPAKGNAREYRIRHDASTGLWSAPYYRVINPATGEAWQGLKTDGRLVGSHFATFTYSADYKPVFGPVTPGRFSWESAPAGVKGAATGYLTREALVAAITGRAQEGGAR